MSSYVNLHWHSTYSYGDGIRPVEEHVAAAANLDYSAMALTDHGNVSGHVKLEQACQKVGIKPIFGVEAYCEIKADERGQLKHHLTVLAENQIGYQNLNRLVSASWQNFRYKPTVTSEMLLEHSDGLIVMSGCMGGLLADTMIGGKVHEERERADLRAAERVAGWFADVFEDRYYLETMPHPQLTRQKMYNQALAELGARMDLPLVATLDCHYPTRDMQDLYPVVHAIDRGGRNNTVEAQSQSWEYDILLAPRSARTVYKELQQTGLSRYDSEEAMASTVEIAKRCNVVIPKFQELKFPGDRSSDELLWDWCRQGWKYRGLSSLGDKENTLYVDRIKYELDLMIRKGFADYFLVISELVRWAKNNEIAVGPARGSGAASLVCYLLRITEVNPMLFPTLLFERFIDENRHDLPDVDLDFDDERRWEVRQHLVEMYGEDHVGNIGTFTQYKGKNSLDDIARVYRVPVGEVTAVKEMIIERSSGDLRGSSTIEDSIEMFPKVRSIFDKYPALYKAQRLEGCTKGFSVHAAGLVVANEPLTNGVAAYTRVDSKTGLMRNVLSIDKYDAEHINALKIDALGLLTMNVIARCLRMVGMSLEELYEVSLDEEEVFEAFRRNEVVGVFQFDGRAMRSVNREVKPDNFMELGDINALSRPGPLHSGAASEYIQVKHGRKPAEHLHPVVDEITQWTNYQIVYQEQILQVVRKLANFSWENAAKIRKLISKKQGEQAFNRMQELFLDGCRANGVKELNAGKIWKQLVTAGAYAFCPTGDAVVYTAGSNENGRRSWKLEELYETINGPRSPIRDKLKYGQGGRKALLHQLDDDGRIRPRDFVDIQRSPEKVPILRFTVGSGRTIRVSYSHRFMTTRGYVVASELEAGDDIVMCDPMEKYEQPATTYDGRNNQAWRNTCERVRVRSQERCEHCGKEDDGKQHALEFSHILPLETFSGNLPQFHHPRNVLHLCNSCHKKLDYEKGERTYPHSVGKSSWSERITSVEHAGHDYVYEVEMLAPNHNFVANGFVSHNNSAHSISYAMIAYWTMWLKVNYPLEFYCAALQKYDPKTKGFDLLKEAVKRGIDILPPDPVRSDTTWSVHNGQLLAGLTQIDGIGEKTARAMVEWRGALAVVNSGRPDASLRWDDFTAVKGIGPATMEKVREFVEAEDPFEIDLLANRLGKVRGWLNRNADAEGMRCPTSRAEDVPYEPQMGQHVVLVAVRDRNLKDLYELHRSRTGEELDPSTVREPEFVNWSVILGEDETGPLTITVHRYRGLYEKYKDVIWELNPKKHLLLVRGLKRREYRRAIYAEELWVIDPEELRG